MLEFLTIMHYVSQVAAVLALSLLIWHYVKPNQSKSSNTHRTAESRDQE